MSKLTANEEFFIERTADDILSINCSISNEYKEIYKILKKLVKKVNKNNNKKIVKLGFTIETMINLAKTKREPGEYLNIEISKT